MKFVLSFMLFSMISAAQAATPVPAGYYPNPTFSCRDTQIRPGGSEGVVRVSVYASRGVSGLNQLAIVTQSWIEAGARTVVLGKFIVRSIRVAGSSTVLMDEQKQFVLKTADAKFPAQLQLNLSSGRSNYPMMCNQ